MALSVGLLACDSDGGQGPEPVTGVLVSMSPATTLAHSPERVRIALRVDAPERLQELLKAGASLQARLVTASGPTVIEAGAIDGGVGSLTTDANLLVEIQPDASDGPQLVGVDVELVDVDETVRSLGEGVLRLRGDATALALEDRDAETLAGLVAPDRVWTRDLDGDGVEDYVVSDIDESDMPLLRVFRCDADRCTPAGEASLAEADGERPGRHLVTADGLVSTDGILAPDMVAATEPGGFLGAMVTARASGGGVETVVVLHLALDDDGSLQESRAAIDLREVGAAGTLHAQALKPQMFRDAATGSHRPGLVVTRTTPGDEATAWSTLHLDADGLVDETRDVRAFDGLSDAEMEAARAGQIATCLSAGQMSLDPSEAPTGAVLSAFVLDGVPRVAGGSLDATDGPMQVVAVDPYYDPQLHGDAFGSVACQLRDLDGDGLEDLVVALAAGDVYSTLDAADGRTASLLVAHGLSRVDAKRALEGAALVFEDADAGDWSLFHKQGLVYFRTGRDHALGVGHGVDVHAAAVLDPDSDQDGRPDVDAAGRLSFQVVDTPSCPRGLSVVSLERAGEPAALASQDGGDTVLRKLPGRRDADVSSAHGGLITEVVPWMAPEGMWLVADFGGGLRPGGAGEPMLAPADRERLIGLLSSTGPFIPLPPPSDGEVDSPGGVTLVGAQVSSCDRCVVPVRIAQRALAADGTPTELSVSTLALKDGAIVESDKRTVTVDFGAVAESARSRVEFKAGAELSKAASAAAGGGSGDDCDDTRPCPAPGRLLLAFASDSGAISTGVLDLASNAPVVVEPSGLREELADALGLESVDALAAVDIGYTVVDLGGGPLAVLEGLHNADGETTDAMVAIDRRGAVSRRVFTLTPTTSLHFADVLGEGFDQLVHCETIAGEVTCQTLQMDAAGGGLHDLTGAGWSNAATVAGDVVIVAEDLDGDGCADLMTSRGELVSSLCDGRFAPAGLALGGWSAHLAPATRHNHTARPHHGAGRTPPDGRGGYGSQRRASCYNAARSNKPSPPDTREDTEAPGGSLVLYDAVELPRWR